MIKPKHVVIGGFLGMLAGASLFALTHDGPAPGHEGLMGVANFFEWLGELRPYAIAGAVAGAAILGYLGRVTPPALERELLEGHWRTHSALSYAAGTAGALVGLGLFGLAALPLAFVPALFTGSERAAFPIVVVLTAISGIYGAKWCGRRALWQVEVSRSVRSAPATPQDQ
jgi:hypothetical protein